MFFVFLLSGIKKTMDKNMNIKKVLKYKTMFYKESLIVYSQTHQ